MVLHTTTVVLVVAMLCHRARADEPRRILPPVRYEFAACLGRDFDPMLHALRDVASPSQDIRTIDVVVDCVADGLDSGVVIEIRRPDRRRSYLYALDWHVQPRESRPHLLELAIAEALAASRLGLVAVAAPPVGADPTEPPPPGTGPDWAVALIGTQRSFVVSGGIALGGGGVMPSRRVSRHLRFGLDVVTEGASIVLSKGPVEVLTVSSGPRITYRFGGRLHADLGFGLRFGVVRMRGPGFAESDLAAKDLVRVWAGPTTPVTFGVDLTPGVSLDAGFELGVVEGGANARDMGLPVVVMGGAWTSFSIAAAIAL